MDETINEGNPQENQNQRLTKQEKEIEVGEVLNNIENGTFEIYKSSGPSAAWSRFVKIRNAESKQRIYYAQCTECKALLTYKEHGGTSHLNRHTCKINELTTEMLPFRTLPPEKMGEVQSVLVNKVMKFCAEDLSSYEAICDSTNFIDFLQYFVSMGQNLGNIELKGVFPKSSAMRQEIINFKEEKQREIYSKFREAFRKERCSASLQIQQVLDKILLIMRIHYFESDLSALSNKVIFATSFDEMETPGMLLAKIIEHFKNFGGDEEDLQNLKIVTPTKQIILKALDFKFTRNDCIPDIITDILNESFDISPTTETVNFLSACTNIVQFIRESDKYNLELISDNSIWKNRFLMVRSINEQFNDIVIILKNNNLNFNKRRAEEFITFLEPFVEALDDLAAVSCPTSNKVILWWMVIKDHLGTADNYSYELKHIMLNAMDCFRSKFPLTIDNKIDCFLDPRYKMLKMLGESERSEVITEVRNRLEGIIVEQDVPIASASAPQAKKRKFAEYETKKGDCKAVLPQKESNKSKEAKKKTIRFKNYETNDSDLDQNDEIMKYLKLAAMNSSQIESELDIVTKFWVSKQKYLPKLYKLATSRLHTPACCGCVGQNDFTSKQHLKDEPLKDLLFIKDKL